MLESRGWRTSLLAVTLAVACGDSGGPTDFTPPGRDDGGPMDATVDAFTPGNPVPPDPDASPMPVDATVDAPDTKVPDEEDSGAPLTCEDLDCSKLDDECNVGLCDSGSVTCVAAPVLDGTSCGSAADEECTSPDTCEDGVCVPNHETSGEPCGVLGVACHFDDTCDGSGHCQDNGLWTMGTFCGDMTDTECDNPDSCNAAGQCVPRYEPVDAPCGDQGIACRVDDGCNGLGACTDKGAWVVGSCPHDGTGSNCYCGEPDEPPLTECHPQRDICSAGECISGDVDDGTLCGDPTDEDCNGADACVAGVCDDQIAPLGAACGDPTSNDCNGADTCDGSGTCLDNFALIDTPCGNMSTTQCTDPDTCDGAGVCLGNHNAPGAPCGDVAQACLYDDQCSVDGTCADNGVVPGCFITVNGTVGELGSFIPLAGVTVTVLGSNPLETDVTGLDGSFTLDVVPATDLILHFQATATHWGLYKAYRFLPTAPDIGMALMANDTDATSGTSMVPGLPPIDFNKGIVGVEFSNVAAGGGESALLSAGSAPSFTLDADGMGVLSGSLLPSGQSRLVFINVTTGSTTVNIVGAPGVNDCSPAHPGIVNWPITSHTVTEVSASCADL